ncbi:MAG: DnaK suppressor protein [Hyphomonadaceae bacterium]|nr:MAG: DnaK suppressor protein [Hyphomonadaceae bacterium]KAF0184360.1 MAG: DnaK suppressor protein [Hyphomonadaceae bacterium]
MTLTLAKVSKTELNEEIHKMEQDLGNYVPTDDEPFMNERQLQFFKIKLETWKADILEDSQSTISQLQNDSVSLPDSIDRASSETEKGIELRTRDRQRKLIAKIDDALKRINDGEYGFCEESGEPISLARLIARPIATLSLEAQEHHERQEKIHRDD